MVSSVIETEGLTKNYGKSRGIREVDLSVNEGEVFGFLGPNGAGKTTTIRTPWVSCGPLVGRRGSSGWTFGGRAWTSGRG